MSLQVWLPLDGSLENQGLSTVTITNHGATVDDSGKIGKCYYFNGSSYIQISMPSNMTTIKNTTVAAWVKSHSTTVALGGISHDSGTTMAGMTYYTSGWQFSGSGYKYLGGGAIANTQTWHHVACTLDDETITTYLDGVKVNSNTLTEVGVTVTDITSDNFIEIGCDHPGGNEFLTGYVNDFRVYDHALSAKEIKELSKGLVLHYKLDKIHGGNANLLKNTSAEWTNLNMTTSSYYTQFGTDYQLEAGETYTFSVLIEKLSTDTDPINVHLGNGVSGNYQHDITSWRLNDITSGERVVLTYTVTSSDLANNYLYFAWRIRNEKKAMNIRYKEAKLEKGDKVTPWIPNAADSEYVDLGLDDNIEYDCSGYGNNGSLIDATSVSKNDSARYNNSLYFNGTTSGIIINDLNISNIINTAVTYSFWIKPDGENGARSVYFGSYSGTSWSIEKTVGNVLRSYWNGNPDTATTLSITDGQWQHIVITKNGTSDIKFYLNGVLKQSITTTHNNLTFPTTFRIGRDVRSGDGTPYKGLMSDFRIYATALSAEDILELYQTAASVDNNGNVYAYEVVE